MDIERIDHFVLTVRDIEATCAFYSSVLSMEVVTFGDNRKALHFGNQKINLHQTGNEFEPKAQAPTPGSADLCLISKTPLEQIVAHLEAQGVTIIAGPVGQQGAIGPITSVYFADLDGNLIEVSNYLDTGRKQP